MTENAVKEFWIGVEGLQAGIVRRAGDIAEDAETVDRVRDDLAEWMLSASKGIPIPDTAIASVRMRLADLFARLQQRGLDEAAAAEGLVRLIGEARAAADTIEIDLATVAASDRE